MSSALPIADLEAYLDEALSAAEMTRIETLLRSNPDQLARLASIHARRDQGVHSVGEIWRRHRITCVPREQLGSYLLDSLDNEYAAYVHFHLETIGCRVCQANLEDLRKQAEESGEQTQKRRQRYFQSTAGNLRKRS